VIAAQQVAPSLRIVVMMTVDEEGNCLDGASAETAAARLTELGADAVGCNCSAGPATVLSVIERMRRATDLPLAAMPNAGMPREVEGRNIYMASPEYMASFARKFAQSGASFLGGCCGTTPSHIRAMRSALRALDAQEHAIPRLRSTLPARCTGPSRLQARWSRRRWRSARRLAGGSRRASL
jgi:homocysteine S-methyltransferase